MNSELIMVFLPALSWLLFALGGTQISDEINGWKGWRRFILPAFYLLSCLLNGVNPWKALLVCGLSITAYSLGYGERKTWLRRCFVALAYGFLTIPIGLSWWNLVTVIMFILLFLLSNTSAVANIFVWKICEGFFGLGCGIQLAYLLMGHGLVWR